MFRAALLSIVLTLAAGQDAALWCGLWCHSGGQMSGGCEHQTEPTSLGIIGNNDCTIDGNAMEFVREDARQSVSAPSVQSGAALPLFVLTPPASGRHSGDDAAGHRLLDLRPLAFALRI